MKNIYWFIALALTFTSLASCKKIDKFTQKTIILSEEVILPSAIAINLPFTIPTPPITTNIEEELSVDNSHKNLIEKATLTSLTLTITAPDNKTFQWLNDADIYIQAEGLSELLIASKHDIPSDIGSTLVFNNIPDTNIADYIKKDNFTLHLKVVTDQINLQEVTVQIDANVFVDAKILGV